jgi:hypothetical protein
MLAFFSYFNALVDFAFVHIEIPNEGITVIGVKDKEATSNASRSGVVSVNSSFLLLILVFLLYILSR